MNEDGFGNWSNYSREIIDKLIDNVLQLKDIYYTKIVVYRLLLSTVILLLKKGNHTYVTLTGMLAEHIRDILF